MWVGADCVSEEDHKNLLRAGINVTRFVYPLENASLSVIECAFATVEEHHPRETVWLPRVSDAGMKNIHVIEGAVSCVYDIFAATPKSSKRFFQATQISRL